MKGKNWRKRLAAAGISALMAMSMVACGDATKEETLAETVQGKEEGKVFHIYAWDDGFKELFESYYAEKLPEGVQVKWTIVPSEDGAYEESLDNALMEQFDLADDEKVDLFLAEPEYILKYVNSEASQDVKELGLTDFSNAYDYTLEVCTDEAGIIKGVSYQCCPSALIYRRSIAREVLGTDDPVKVQEAMSDWDKFEQVAYAAKEKGYLITPSFAETYPAYFNQISNPWVDDNFKLQLDGQLEAWIDQTMRLVEAQATLTNKIGDDRCISQMGKDGLAMCCFGPAWCLEHIMEAGVDSDKMLASESSGSSGGFCPGDWGICPGPVDYFQGGTWLLAASGSDNPSMLVDIMDTFINNEEVCEKLVSVNHLFCNNQAVMDQCGAEESYGNELLGGQNDLAVYAEIARGIRFEKRTFYDEILNEGLQDKLRDYFQGTVPREEAMEHFYMFVNDQYPSIETP